MSKARIIFNTAFAMFAGFLMFGGFFKANAAGNDITSRANIVADFGLRDGGTTLSGNDASATWTTSLSVNIPGFVKAGDYIRVEYENFTPYLGGDIIYNGEIIGSANTNHYRSKNLAEDNHTLNHTYDVGESGQRSGYIRITFNSNAEKYADINFEMTNYNNGRYFKSIFKSYQFTAKMSAAGKELVSKTFTVDKAEVKTDLFSGNSFSWSRATLENNGDTFVPKRYQIAFRIDSYINAGESISVTLSEESPIRFSKSATINRILEPDYKNTIFTDAHGILYYPKSGLTGDSFSTTVSDDLKTLTLTFADDYDPSNINPVIIVSFTGDSFTIDNSSPKTNVANNIVESSSYSATWTKPTYTNGWSKKTWRGDEQFIFNKTASSAAASSSKTVEYCYTDESTTKLKCITLGRFRIGEKYEITEDQLLDGLPEGYYFVNNLAPLSGIVNDTDWTVLIPVSKNDNRNKSGSATDLEKIEIAEEINETSNDASEISAPDTGFSDSSFLKIAVIFCGIMIVSVAILVTRKTKISFKM